MFAPGSPYTELPGEEAPWLTQRGIRVSDVNARLWVKMKRAERECGRERHAQKKFWINVRHFQIKLTSKVCNIKCLTEWVQSVGENFTSKRRA